MDMQTLLAVELSQGDVTQPGGASTLQTPGVTVLAQTSDQTEGKSTFF